MDILLLDIERTPAIVDAWSLWNVNVGINQIRQPPGLLCFAAKWLGEPKSKTVFYSQYHHGREAMIGEAHGLLDRADAVMTWYGKKHDVPALNLEFLALGLTPPAPFQHIDLYQAVKRNFLFPSNKLQYVSTALGFKGKVAHEGHGLWVKCMAGDPKAWKRMELYNRQDVWLLEQVYRKVQPWVNAHPSHAAHGDQVCPKCGSGRLQRRGESVTALSVYQRYQCQGCGAWSRDVKRLKGATLREVA